MESNDKNQRGSAAGDQSSVNKGHEGEEEACKFIAQLGYKIIKRNFKYGRIGEIDIVAEHEDTLVFIEVKGRSNYSFGTPEESVNPRKQAQLKKVASMYYYVNGIQDKACRFDVVAVDKLFGKTEIRHHIAAFF
jgi:putative endonuclease